MKIAIHQNHEIFCHSTAWDRVWIEYCIENKLDYEIVNCFDNNILEKLTKFDILLWHFSNYSLQDMLFARSILNSAVNLGLKVFPDFNTAWHFDDKVAQSFLLKSVGAPIPESRSFFTYRTAVDFFEKECKFPIVAKLRCGSGSNNVRLIKNKSEACKYAKRMFGKGYNPVPSILFKSISNIRSAGNWETIKKRFKRIPDFIETFSNARQLPTEKGYVLLQEYIPNDGYDLKVVVVGDKLSFLARDVRKGDFRASGGGSIRYDKSLLSQDIRKIAFELSDKFGFQCMGYDFVIDKRDNLGKIVEISYGFSHTAQMDLGGYWDRQDNWNEVALNAPLEVMINLVKQSEQSVI